MLSSSASNNLIWIFGEAKNENMETHMFTINMMENLWFWGPLCLSKALEALLKEQIPGDNKLKPHQLHQSTENNPLLSLSKGWQVNKSKNYLNFYCHLHGHKNFLLKGVNRIWEDKKEQLV